MIISWPLTLFFSHDNVGSVDVYVKLSSQIFKMLRDDRNKTMYILLIDFDYSHCDKIKKRNLITEL